MIEIVLNDRIGKKIRVKCNPDDTIGDIKKLVKQIFNFLVLNLDGVFGKILFSKLPGRGTMRCPMGKDQNSEVV